MLIVVMMYKWTDDECGACDVVHVAKIRNSAIGMSLSSRYGLCNPSMFYWVCNGCTLYLKVYIFY